MVTKKAKAAQGKKALECRGSPLANAKEFFAKSEEVRHLIPQLDKKCFSYKKTMHIPVFNKKGISRLDIYSNDVITIHCSSQKAEQIKKSLK